MSSAQRRSGDAYAVQNAPCVILERDSPRRYANRLTAGFAITSFFAVATGCFVVHSVGVGFGVWGRNAAAWVVGAILAGVLARIGQARHIRGVLLIAPLALLASLFDSGTAGVHRWLTIGPLSWNVSFLLLPAATVALAATARRGPRWTRWAVMLIQVELVIQPDASQATAFAAATIVTVLTTRSAWEARATSLFFLLTSVVAWIRPDRLAPLPEVEGILTLAGAVSRPVAALCVASLAAVTIAPLLARKIVRDRECPAAVALSVYFLGCILMPLFGAFPIPLAGMGMSPILGFWLGIGALNAVQDFTRQTDDKQVQAHIEDLHSTVTRRTCRADQK